MAGAYESDEFELALAETADILVLTPEKLDLLERLTPDMLDRVALVLLDEYQVLGDATRGAKYELLITRLRRRLPSARFLSLSAVVSSELLEKLALWLGGTDPMCRTGRGALPSSEWRLSSGRAQKEACGTRPDIDTDALAEFVPGIVTVQRLSYVNPETARRNTISYPDQGNKGTSGRCPRT